MTNLIISFDNSENVFSQLLRNISVTHRMSSNIVITEITHPHLSLQNVRNKIYELISKNEFFIFAAFSHGLDDQLISAGNRGNSYVDLSISNYFKNSVFYTFSCSTGKTLAGSLKKNGCIAYFGYFGKVLYLNDQLFISCNVNIVNSGLNLLLRIGKFDNSKLVDAKNTILDEYDMYIGTHDDLGFKKCWANNLLCFNALI